MHRREKWSEMFKVMRKKAYQHRILYIAKLSFKCEGNTLSQTKKLGESVANRSVLKEMFKEVFSERNDISQKLRPT